MMKATLGQRQGVEGMQRGACPFFTFAGEEMQLPELAREVAELWDEHLRWHL